MTAPPQPIPSTPARTLKLNFERMGSLITVLAEDAEAHRQGIDDLSRDPAAPDWEVRHKAVRDGLEQYLKVRRFVHQWYVVMMVTFTETYLHDILVAAAGVEPTLMNESKQTLSYSDVITASSVGELAVGMRSRWAHNFIDGSGPAGWIDRFTRMGCKTYAETLATRLELIWGIRHVVVHAAGVATADFARRHPDFGAQVGQQIGLDKTPVLEYLQSITQFVEPTDAYFVARFGQL